MLAAIVPLLGGLFFILGAGALLRARGTMGAADALTLQRVIVNVTMPALLVRVLAERGLHWQSLGALAGTTLALLVSAALAVVVTRSGGGDRGAQGSAALTGSFCNTGFVGFPLVLSLFPGDSAASSTALVVDTLNTTLLLWTAGAAFAARMGHGSSGAGSLRRLLVEPMPLAIVVGLGLHALQWQLPAAVDGALATAAAATLPLVFLSLGLLLDPGALLARAALTVRVAAVKLLVSPLVCWIVVRLLDLPEPVASVAVLQSAMPSALVSVMVADQGGCDRTLAVGVAGLTALLCLLTLPLMGFALTLGR